jgi:dihydroorotase
MITETPLRVVGGDTEVGKVVRMAPTPGGWKLESSPEPGTDWYISPGWVDLHAHVYDGFTVLSVHPDTAGYRTGVTLVVDAGSSGEASVDGLVRYVVPTARTPVRAWLNIGSHGLVHLRELADLSWLDVGRTLGAIDRHSAFICGVKVRSSGAIVGASGLQPLKLARLVARHANLPLMVHIGEAPPLVEDVLGLLDKGDVVTHCYHGKVGTPWDADGSPSEALRRAVDRGVLLDVGHGRASFRWETARRAVNAGWPPFTISTDLHVRNVGGPVHDLATTMSKFLAAGMSLSEVVSCVTTNPRQVLGTEPWVRPGGAVVHATIFRLADGTPKGRIYEDCHGTAVPVRRCIAPQAVVLRGQLLPCVQEMAPAV